MKITLDKFEPNEKHKKFIKNDLLFFIKIYKKLNKGFKNIRFLLNNTIIINNRTKCDYQRIKFIKKISLKKLNKLIKKNNFLDVNDCILINDEYVLFTNYYY